MNLLWAMLVVVAFAVLLERLHVADRARAVVDRAKGTLLVLRDSQLSDEEKERTLRRDAIHLFGQSGALVGLSVVALVFPLGGVWLIDQAGWVALHDVLVVLQRLDFLLVATIIGAGAYYVSLVLARE